MPETHDSKPFTFARGPLIVHCESLFWHPQRYPGRRVAGRPPLTELAAPRELEQPYRKGHGRVFRIPLTRRAVVLGYWEPAGEAVLADEESTQLLAAVEGAHIPGITATEIADWARARDWSRVQLLLRRLRALLGLGEPVARPQEAVADDDGDGMPGWMAEEGWSLLPWDGGPDDGGPVLDLEQARVKRKPGVQITETLPPWTGAR